MVIQHLSHDELRKVLTQLDQVIYNHQQWYNSLIRSFVCNMQADINDIAPDAHKRCRFGQWYYQQAPEYLKNNESFIAIAESHKNMHDQTRNLLNKKKSGGSISPSEFDRFTTLLEKLRLAIFTLKNEFETLLYTHDPLTMAISRINLLTILREQHAFTKRHHSPCSIAMIDFDFFKDINDHYGHICGDKVLANAAKTIMQNLRQYDKLFRYGGEEFLLCFPQTNLLEALEICDRIRKIIAETPIDIGNNNSINITISVGMCELDTNEPIEQSIEKADKALYKAKTSGRNLVMLWKNETAHF